MTCIRGQFSSALVAFVAALLCLLIPSLGLPAEDGAYQEGVHYVRLTIPSETPQDTIEVIEVFSYGCPHCMNLEGPLDEWLADQPTDVSLRRVPATFSRPYQMLAAVYYASEQLGVTDLVHTPIFEALQIRNLNVLRMDILQRLFQDYADVEGEALEKALNSFSVQTKVRQADALARVFRVVSVPTLVVAGEYKVTPPPEYGGARQLQIAQFLIDQVRSERAAAGSN